MQTGLYAIPLKFNLLNNCNIEITKSNIQQKNSKSGFPAQGKTLTFVNAKAPTLTARHAGDTKILFAKPQKNIYNVVNGMILINDKWYPCRLDNGYYEMRILTVKECARLQTIPEWYEFPVSKSQSYKMIGNGWTVEVIKHLITSAYSRPVVNQSKQLTFDGFVN